jgi:hypothetical protein
MGTIVLPLCALPYTTSRTYEVEVSDRFSALPPATYLASQRFESTFRSEGPTETGT